MSRGHYSVRELVKTFCVAEPVLWGAIANGELRAQRFRIGGRERVLIPAEAWVAWAMSPRQCGAPSAPIPAAASAERPSRLTHCTARSVARPPAVQSWPAGGPDER